MRHLNRGRKFGMKTGQRRSFLKIMAGNLVEKERIVTTEARAKALRAVVERLITYGKKQNLASLRILMSKIPKSSAYKVYNRLAPRYKDRKGGYTRVSKLAKTRQNDSAKMAIIEFV